VFVVDDNPQLFSGNVLAVLWLCFRPRDVGPDRQALREMKEQLQLQKARILAH
jgi:hypothetical protein